MVQILRQQAGNKDNKIRKPIKGNGGVILDSSRYSLKMKENQSDCTKFVKIRDDWDTILFRYQDKVSCFVDELNNSSSIDEGGKNSLKNSGSFP